MTDDNGIAKWEDMTPEERKEANEMFDALEKALKNGTFKMIEIRPADPLIGLYKRMLNEQSSRVPALIRADKKNMNGIIDRDEYSAAMKHFYSETELAVVAGNIDCKNPNSGKGPIVAEDATKEADRLLGMLQRKEPGYGAKEYIDWMTNVFPIDQQMGEGTGEDLRKRLPEIFKAADVKTLAIYEQMVSEKKLGSLVPQRLVPLKPEDLCKGLEAAR